MSELSFSHLIEIDESSRQVKIYRVFHDGEKQLYTETVLPAKTLDEDRKGFEEFTRILGENILIDSPAARRVLGI